MLHTEIQLKIINSIGVSFGTGKFTENVIVSEERDKKLLRLFSPSKYDSMSKDLFKAYCLYLSFKKSKIGIYDLVQALSEERDPNFKVFLNEIKNRKAYVQRDKDYFDKVYWKQRINQETLVQDYLDQKISWITACIMVDETPTNSFIKNKVVKNLNLVKKFFNFNDIEDILSAYKLK